MKIPFELLGWIILIDICVNGKSRKMAFDTGVMQSKLPVSEVIGYRILKYCVPYLGFDALIIK